MADAYDSKADQLCKIRSKGGVVSLQQRMVLTKLQDVLLVLQDINCPQTVVFGSLDYL